MAASPIEMGIWFFPVTWLTGLRKQDKSARGIEHGSRARDYDREYWLAFAFRMVIWGFLGLVAGLAALVPSILTMSLLFGEDAGRALFSLVIAVR